MGKSWRVVIVALIAVSLLGAVVGSAVAFGWPYHHGVTRSGSCSGTSSWRLHVDDDMMMGHDLGAHFDVWTNKAGQTWKVNLKDNGTIFWRGYPTTGWNGHFMVHGWTYDRAGTDRVIATGVNQVTGEVCSGAAPI